VKRIKKIYPKTFLSGVKTNPFIPKSSRSKEIEKVYPKTFWVEEKTKLVNPNSSGSKRIEKVCSKTVWIEEKTNFHIPKLHRIKVKTNQKPSKLFRIEVERTKLFQNFSRSKWTKPNYSKTVQDPRRTNQISPNLFKRF